MRNSFGSHFPPFAHLHDAYGCDVVFAEFMNLKLGFERKRRAEREVFILRVLSVIHEPRVTPGHFPLQGIQKKKETKQPPPLEDASSHVPNERLEIYVDQKKDRRPLPYFSLFFSKKIALL